MSDIKDALIKLLRDDPAFRRELISAINMEDAAWGERLESIRKLLEEQSKLSVENTRILEGLLKSTSELTEVQKGIESELARLVERINNLTEAQKKIEEGLNKLTERVNDLTDRLDKLTETQKRTDERLDKLTERVTELAELQKRTDERLDKLTERVNDLTERVNELAEAQKRTEDGLSKLTDAISELSKEVMGLKKRMDSMGRRWGEDYEEVIKLFFKELVEVEEIDLRYVNRFTYKDEAGQFGPKGSIYEIDILARNGRVYLIEVKSFADEDDLDWFNVKCSTVTKALGFKDPIKLFLAVSAAEEAVERAKNYGIKMLTGDVIEKRRAKADQA
ncbi:MAG: DUF3782 domain-containing protein [Thermocladium sp.]